MGRARILDNLGAGRYRVEVLHDRQRTDQERARLEARRVELAARRSAQEAARAAAQALVDQALAALDMAIDAYAAEPGADTRRAMEEAQRQVIEASGDRDRAALALRTTQGDLLSIIKRLQAIDRIPPDPIQEAWCADYSDDLTGEVGTIELPGEGSARLLIRPGFDGAAGYNAARDGQLTHRAACSPGQAYLAAALLPGWQRWRPLHRVGTLQAVTADQCDLTVHPETSSAQDLPIQDAQALQAVPIHYMDCHGVAFEPGDEVVIEYQGQDRTKPRVVGFHHEPRPCIGNIYLLVENLARNQHMIVEFSPTLERVIAVRAQRALEFYGNPTNPKGISAFGVTQGRVAYDYHTYHRQPDNSLELETEVVVDGERARHYPLFAATHSAGLCASGDEWFIAETTVTGETTGYREFVAADLTGQHDHRRFDATGGGLLDWSLPTTPRANHDSLLTTGWGTDGHLHYLLLDSANGAVRWQRGPWLGSPSQISALTRNRVYAFGDWPSGGINILDTAGNQVGTWEIPTLTHYQYALVGLEHGIVFNSSVPSGGPGNTAWADFYTREGDDFTFSHTVDLNALGFSRVYQAEVDSYKLLRVQEQMENQS